MYVIANFTNGSVPESGLTPNIAIYRIADNAQAVATTTMTEITNGSYKYNFVTITAGQDYDVWIDGGATLDNSDRYKHQIVTANFDRSVDVIL